MKAAVLKAIPHGAGNAVTGKALSQIIGIDARTIKAIISKCRRQGVIICSSLDQNNGGYFYPESLAELKEYVDTESQRIATATAALKPAIDELERRKGNEN